MNHNPYMINTADTPQPPEVGWTDTAGWNSPITVCYGPPTQPTSVVAAAGNQQIALSWTAPVTNVIVVDYIVQYSSDGGVSWTSFADNTSPASATSTLIYGLSNSLAYVFRVAAVGISTCGTSAWSALSNAATPLATNNYIAPPSLLVASGAQLEHRGTYAIDGITNGKPQYRLAGGAFLIYWSGSQWELKHYQYMNHNPYMINTADTPQPPEVGWTDTAGWNSPITIQY
jgi:hypothetical protein